MPGRTNLSTNTPTIFSVRKDVSNAVPKILDQVQASPASHQKNLVALYKVQTDAAMLSEPGKRGRTRIIGERIFWEFVLQMFMRVLPMKKGIVQADRVVKFVAAYVKFVNEKAAEDGEGEEEDTMATRFTKQVLKFLMNGFSSKDKAVRYRVLQASAEMMAHLGEIDEDTYDDLRKALLERVTDKETNVRVQAVIALCKLCGADDPSDTPKGELVPQDVILDTLAHDTSAEVRRAALVNVTINPTTLPHLIDRTRDTDTITRKLVYNNVLIPNVTQGDTDVVGSTHPRALTITQRELIIRNGLGDREATVRNAAADLLARWVEVVTPLVTKEESKDEDVKPTKGKKEDGLIELLKMLDLMDSTVAVGVVLSVFATQPDILNEMEFDNDYWSNLTQEKAFLARVFVGHCRDTDDEVRLEAALPVVTALAFRIQEAYNSLMEFSHAIEEERLVRNLDEDEEQKLEDERNERELIIGEMLKLAVSLDYSDEIGRRKMFQLVRDMLSQDKLPKSFLWKCLDVLRVLSASERDLIRVVVEIIQDLRDLDEEYEQENPDADRETNVGETPATVRPQRVRKPPAERTPEEQKRAEYIDLRCLHLCTGMLERVNGRFEENSTLNGILDTLIFPSIKNNNNTLLRQNGFIGLGLICLISKRVAFSSLDLFFKRIADAPEELKISILQVLFDMFMVHEHELLRQDAGENNANIVNYLMELLSNETSPKVQALLCVGISKLVLSGMITDLEVLENLVRVFVIPSTATNQELRQCLTFFFNAYSNSSPKFQKNMREIFIETFVKLNGIRRDLEDDEEMISASQVGGMFLDWTDPLKLQQALDAAKSDLQADEFIHLDLACDIFKALLGVKRKKDADDAAPDPKDKYLKLNLEPDDTKVLCQLLSKLHIPDSVDDLRISQFKLWMNKIRSHRPLRDTVAKNAFTKFEANIMKKFETQSMEEEDLRKLHELNDMFEDLDDIIPLDEDEDPWIDAPKKSTKKRSASVTTATTEDDPGQSRPGRSKRPRLSNSDNDSDEVVELSLPPDLPKRTQPKRASRKPVQPIEISSDSDEEATPVQRRKRPPVEVKEEHPPDSDELPEHGEDGQETTFDSIMDDSQDEEEEVNELLAGD